MATAAPAAPHRGSRSFAKLLEESASPPRKLPPGRDLDFLEDDVATLSYEHALKAHSRMSREPGPDPQANSSPHAAQPKPLIPRHEPQALPRTLAPSRPEFAARKSASVTVRLTAEEDDRMRARAIEAGLTVSSYLRYCAFEVESLRAQVREAVACMREAEKQAQAPRRSWLVRILRRAPR